MRSTIPSTAVAAILALGVAPAFAGALDGPAPEPMIMEPIAAAPAADWSGPYAGLQLGYGFSELNLDPGDIDELDSDGVIGGFHIGYLWDFGDWVVGPELQYDAAELSVDGDSGSGSFDEIARLKVRAGRDLGQSMVYGSAGFAYTNFDGLSGVDDIDFEEPGYVLGVGYDYRLNQGWTVGAEYQWHRFNDFGFDGNDVDLQTVHLRASYNF